MLEINIEKGNILIFNMKDQLEHLDYIKVVPKVKYLGLEIDNKYSSAFRSLWYQYNKLNGG